MDKKIKREQVIRDAKSNIILDAARKVFSERGFHETRLEDIATEAGFSKASLYNYYSDKLEIFVVLAIREFDILLERLRLQFNPDQHILKNLEKLLRIIFSFFGVHFTFYLTMTNFRMMWYSFKDDEEKTNCEISEFKSKFTELVDVHMKIIENGRRKGEITAKLPDAYICSYIGSLIRGVVFEWKIKGVSGDIEEEVSRLITFLKSGLECNCNEQI